MRLLLQSPYAPLLLFALATTPILFVSADAQTGAAEIVGYAFSTTWFWLLVIWIDFDARFQRRRPCYDFGFLAYVTFPFSLIWYCVHSRGWKRGLGTLLLLAALSTLPWLILAMYWLIRYGAA